MARKKKHPEHENLERWLVSYADFMTLLFATFTALYALAQTDAAKLKDIGTAIREGFAEQSLINGIKSILQGQSPPNENPDPISSDKGAGPGVIGKFDSMTYQPGEVKSLQHLVDDLTSDLKSANKQLPKAAAAEGDAQKGGNADGKSMEGLGGPATGMTTEEDAAVPVRGVEAAVQQRGVRISFDSRLLFAPGSATLKPGAAPFLDVVANRLKKFDNKRIHVEGHTDNQPIATAVFPSNWELSAGRASSVVRYFIDRHQLNPSSLVAVGYGSTQPLSSNITPEGRTKNRRVDIILYNEQTSALLNPRVQFLNEQPLNTKSTEVDKKAADTVLPLLPTNPKDGPIRVIIKDKDGTERILIPKSKAVTPLDMPESKSASHSSASKPTDASAGKPLLPAKKTVSKPSATLPSHSPDHSKPPVPGSQHSSAH